MAEAVFEKRQYWEGLINRSIARFFLLASLHQRPMHGYELARAITAACGGCCEPSDAMIYPALRELLEGGYVKCIVESQGARQRKVCRLTERGQAAYRSAAEAWRQVLPALGEAVEHALAPQARQLPAEGRVEAVPAGAEEERP